MMLVKQYINMSFARLLNTERKCARQACGQSKSGFVAFIAATIARVHRKDNNIAVTYYLKRSWNEHVYSMAINLQQIYVA